MADSDPPVGESSSVTFAKRKRNANIRKRPREGDGADDAQEQEEDTTTVVRNKPAAKPNPFIVTSQKPKAVEKLSYESNRQVIPLGARDQGATATLETETTQDRDARAIKERVLQESADGGEIYRGMASYGNLIQKREPNQINEKMSAGPIRAPLNVRNTARFDYQPDLCKDYKETGYCGYGDACKFLHDRGDYKTGWQLEREWDSEQEQSKQAKKTPGDEGPGEQESQLPWACFICREAFTDPIVTKCRHYFCEKCALAHFAKSHKCAACDQPTGGVFNRATEVIPKKRTEQEEEKADGDDEGEQHEPTKSKASWKSTSGW
eukprot:CAMPEP_0184662796 /NCGR_PEP_ID=MMETSP0308-20130426/44984_1 /TAXON_ID=38269 /ORGANISM="Gloeochaete witrockiana, Strain SAG 46.84" /LENGTH=321 /DNA_ID=CAMNT_0027105065 /DNA_START=62 /DNA_END=1024 /DNA_ORIENTATION=+